MEVLFMTIYTDNKDFYPTPKTLFHRLIGSRRLHNGKVLEPSAGKGDMIKHIAEISRRRSFAFVDAIENDSRLVSALMGEGISVVWDDFLTYETFKRTMRRLGSGSPKSSEMLAL